MLNSFIIKKSLIIQEILMKKRVLSPLILHGPCRPCRQVKENILICNENNRILCTSKLTTTIFPASSKIIQLYDRCRPCRQAGLSNFILYKTNTKIQLKNDFKYFFPEKKNRIKTKASQNYNNLDKLISIEYSLDNFHRSNQDTCLLHKPSVFEGQWVQSGDLLADCSASVGGELALGQNILIAYMPWEGYNFEDAILVSERLVYDDLYTSVHIERYEVELRQTKQGVEEITRDIPEVSESSLKHLNNLGIAKLGSWIKEGDILVGKVTPVNKKIQSNYQKLLYTILEKTVLPFRDSSLRAPKGIKAKVIGVQIFKNSKNSLISDFPLKKLENLDVINKKKSNLKKEMDPNSILKNKFLKLYSSKKFNTQTFSYISLNQSNPKIIKDNNSMIATAISSMRAGQATEAISSMRAMKSFVSKTKNIFINKNNFFF